MCWERFICVHLQASAAGNRFRDLGVMTTMPQVIFEKYMIIAKNMRNNFRSLIKQNIL